MSTKLPLLNSAAAVADLDIFLGRPAGEVVDKKYPATVLRTYYQPMVTFYASDITGATDVVDELEDFIEANEGKYIFMPEGIYKFSRALNPDCSLLLRGAGPKASIIKYHENFSAIYTEANIDFQEAETQQLAVTSITTENAPDGFTETTDSDYVHVLNITGTIDTDKYKYAGIVAITSSTIHPAGSSRCMGETMKIRWVDVAADKIYLEGKLAQGAASYGATTYVNSVSTERVVDISDIGFQADGDWGDISVDSPVSIHNHAVVIKGAPYSHLSNLDFNGTWEGAIQISDLSPFTVVEGIFGRQLPNLMTGVEYTLGTNPIATDTGSNSAGNTTITITQVAHPWKVGSDVTISGLSAGTYNGVVSTVINGRKTVTAITTDTFSYVVAGTASANTPFGSTTIKTNLNGRLGYGCSVGTLNTGVVVRNCVFHEARHAFTTDGHGGTWTPTKWTQWGQPTHVVFEDCHSRNGYGPGFDTHEEGSFITFKDCTDIHTGSGAQGGSYRGYGMQLRCSNARVINYKQVGGRYGIRIPAMERLAGSDMSVDGATIIGLQSSSDVLPTTASSNLSGASTRTVGVLIENLAPLTNNPTIHLNNIETIDCNQGLVALGGNNLIIKAKGLAFKKAGVPMEIMAGVTVLCSDAPLFDFLGTTKAPTVLNCVNMWAQTSAKVTGTGAKVIFFQKPIILKDSAAKPVNFFNEADTVANKTFWSPGFVEYNPSAVTPTVYVSAGSTTMVEATDVKERVSNSEGYSVRPLLPSGRILVPPVGLNSLTNFTHSSSLAYACPVYVQKRTAFSALCFGINAASTNLNVKVGVYTDLNGLPGSLISGSTVTSGPTTVGASTSVNASFSANLTLDPGWYWLVLQPDQSQSLFAIGSTALTAMIGAGDMIQGFGRITVSNTYASGLPATFGTPTYTAGGGPTYLGLLKA